MVLGVLVRGLGGGPAAGWEPWPACGCAGQGCFGREHQSGQGVDGSGHVEQLRVGVDVRGQLGLGMAHRGLSRTKGNAHRAQVGAKGHSERVNVDDAVSLAPCGQRFIPADAMSYGRCDWAGNRAGFAARYVARAAAPLAVWLLRLAVSPVKATAMSPAAGRSCP